MSSSRALAPPPLALPGRARAGGWRRRLDVRALATFGLAIFVGLVSLLPLLYAVDAAFYRETRRGLSSQRDLTAFLNVFAGPDYWGYLGTALLLAAVVTAFSLLIGVGMALLVTRTDMPMRGLADGLVVMPLYLSPFAGLMAWIALGSERTGFVNGLFRLLLSPFMDNPPALMNIWTYAGVVWVMVLFFCPFAYLFTAGSLRSMDAALEEAARATGATVWQAFRRITLPLTLPAIVGAGLLIFILAAEMYTIPGIIGVNAGFTTLPWQIYQDSVVAPTKPAHAAAASLMLLMVTLAGIWLQRRVTRSADRFVTVGGKGLRATPAKLGAFRWVAFALVLAYILCAVVLPFGALGISSFMRFSAPTISWEVLTTLHYVKAATMRNVAEALWNTLLLALLCGAVCVLIGFLISYLELRRPTRLARLVALAGVLPVGVPGLVYGIGLLWLGLQTPFYGTIWVLLLAFVAKFLPYAIVVSRSSVLQLHRELEESARMSGAGPLHAALRITLPLLRGVLAAVFFFVALMSIKELSASVLLYTQQSQVLSVLTWHYMDAGDYQLAAAIGMIQTLLMVGLVLVTRLVVSVRLDRTLGRNLG